MRSQKTRSRSAYERQKERAASDPEYAERQAEYRKRYNTSERAKERRKAYYEKRKNDPKAKESQRRYQEKRKLIMNTIRQKAKEAGMSLQEYLEAAA